MSDDLYQAINATVAIVYEYGALYWDTEIDPTGLARPLRNLL